MKGESRVRTRKTVLVYVLDGAVTEEGATGSRRFQNLIEDEVWLFE